MTPTEDEKLREAALAVAVATGCGLTIEGERALCDDPRASERVDECSCRDAARAVLALARPSGDERIATLFAAIAHGDEIHRDWLKEAIDNHFTGRPVPPPRAATRPSGDGLREALEEIDRWSKAYPLKVFPEPDLKKAQEVLEAAGITLDAISAAAMRHVIEGVGKIARAAISQPTGKDE